MASGLKRFILWDYPRACWQYDVKVALILAFIFLTPKVWFNDQPRSSSIVTMSPSKEANVYYLEPELLGKTPEAEKTHQAEALLKAYTKRSQTLVRLEPIFNDEQEIKGYMAFTKR